MIMMRIIIGHCIQVVYIFNNLFSHKKVQDFIELFQKWFVSTTVTSTYFGKTSIMTTFDGEYTNIVAVTEMELYDDQGIYIFYKTINGMDIN